VLAVMHRGRRPHGPKKPRIRRTSSSSTDSETSARAGRCRVSSKRTRAAFVTETRIVTFDVALLLMDLFVPLRYGKPTMQESDSIRFNMRERGAF
jgi:hypothetical protein